MRKFTVMFLTFCCITLMSYRLTNGDQPESNPNTIKWVTLEEAIKLNQQQPKKIIVDLYTSWCTWCTKMDKATFQHPAIAQYINENFYAVKLDAETRNTIQFKNNSYAFRTDGGKDGVGVNEIAVYLTRGKLNYPSVIFLDETMSNPQPVAGFQNPIRMDKLLRYFGENHYRKVDWGLFNQIYKSPLETGVRTTTH
ncbi:MAG: DUF255 domain-containing protein [Chitinophagales bacterium]|nr:DUF255 domain-containing protein [Chitinophagales bacterium]